MARNIHYHPERKERVHGEEVLYQSKIKANVKALFRTPTPPSAVDGNTLLSLGLVPSPACGSPWQVHHSSGVPNALRSPVQSRGHLHTTASPGVHAGPPLTRAWLQRQIPHPFSVFFTLRSEPRGQSCQVLLLTGAGT